MTILLAILYPIAVQYERCGWWRLLAPVTVFSLFIDVIANYTELALITWDFPAKNEWTFSTRAQRLQYYAGWRGSFARAVKAYCNFFYKNHI